MTVKPMEQAQEVGKQAREKHIPQAMSEVQRDLRGMNTQQRQEFFGELAKQKGQAGGLPGLEIHGGDGKERKSVAYEGQRPTYQEPDGTIRRGQGPYDALAKGHPDWPPSKVQSEAARVNKETGRGRIGYREGEQIQLGSDGSVTLRNEHPGGKFDEVRYKDGKPMSSRHGDDKGNWSETQYDANGKPKSVTKHEQGEGGNYKETVTGSDGKEISTKSRTTSPDGSYKERETQSGSHNFKETNYDANGKPLHTTDRSYPNPNDPNTYNETRTDGDGKLTSKMERKGTGDPGFYKESTTGYKDGLPDVSPTVRLYRGAKQETRGFWNNLRYETTPDPEHLGE